MEQLRKSWRHLGYWSLINGPVSTVPLFLWYEPPGCIYLLQTRDYLQWYLSAITSQHGCLSHWCQQSHWGKPALSQPSEMSTDRKLCANVEKCFLIMELLLVLWKHSGTLLTLQGNVAFKRKALEQVKSSLNFNLNLPHWFGKLLNNH